MTVMYTPRVLHCGDGLAVAEVGPVCVVIWRDAVTRVRFEKQREGLAEIVERHPGKAGFLCVIEPTAEPPDDELRRASGLMVASHRGRLKCLGTVIEAKGFQAAVVRSVLAGMTLLAGHRGVPLQYFSSIDRAALWMTQHSEIEPRAFLRAVAAVRSSLDAVSVRRDANSVEGTR